MTGLAAHVGERAVLACLGASAISAVPAAGAARALPSPCPPAALPIWLLVAGHGVDAAAAARVLGPALARLRDEGLVIERGGRLHATAAICCLGAGTIVVDRLDGRLDGPVGSELDGGGAVDAASRVPWPDDSSLHLAGCLPAGALGRWLDVGTGAAVAPLAAGRRAIQVRATDINPHALARAAQGARLSGRDDLELIHADLLDGAAGIAWELITFNAPLPDGAPGAVPDTTWFRAPLGAALIERFWAGAGAAREVLAHTAVDADPWAAHAGRGGELTIARYTPPGEPGFAITRWRPHAPEARRLVDVTLDRRQPYLTRATLDAC